MFVLIRLDEISLLNHDDFGYVQVRGCRWMRVFFFQSKIIEILSLFSTLESLNSFVKWQESYAIHSEYELRFRSQSEDIKIISHKENQLQLIKMDMTTRTRLCAHKKITITSD